ncbi:MAG: hypothetical protein LC777_09555, partial [Actinobacteria bacterium]|nr:hypothetical protein [Actinomycetota bacterium]
YCTIRASGPATAHIARRGAAPIWWKAQRPGDGLAADAIFVNNGPGLRIAFVGGALTWMSLNGRTA